MRSLREGIMFSLLSAFQSCFLFTTVEGGGDLDLFKFVHLGTPPRGPVGKRMIGLRQKELLVLLLGFTSDFTVL